MKTIYKTLLLLSFGCLVWACQDEFCTAQTTPMLIIRFKDNNQPTNYKPLTLTVNATNKSEYISAVSTDSIALPLDTSQNITTYELSDGTNTEEITLHYTRENIFVSSACGYKSVFHNLSVDNTQNSWLKAISLSSTSITNEDQAHIILYH